MNNNLSASVHAKNLYYSTKGWPTGCKGFLGRMVPEFIVLFICIIVIVAVKSGEKEVASSPEAIDNSYFVSNEDYEKLDALVDGQEFKLQFQ